MPFEYDDLHVQLDTHLAALNAQQPIVQEDGGRMPVFQPGTYSAVVGQPIVQYTYNQYCWAADLNIQCAAWHDDWGQGRVYPDYGSTVGNAVPITPRHCIAARHGTEAIGKNLVWADSKLPGGSGHDIFVSKAVAAIGAVTYNGIYETPEATGGFNLYYMEPRIPGRLIVPIMLDTDYPAELAIGTPFKNPIPGIPLLALDQFYNAMILCINGYSRLNHIMLLGLPGQVFSTYSIRDPARHYEELLTRQMYPGDSGSPLFVMHRNQTLYYVGNTVEDGGREAATTFDSYKYIVEACQILSQRHNATYGETESFLPNMLYHDPRGPRSPGYRPPPSGPLG